MQFCLLFALFIQLECIRAERATIEPQATLKNVKWEEENISYPDDETLKVCPESNIMKAKY